MNLSTVFIKDLAERVVVTFIEGWIGAWLVIQDRELDQLFDPKTLGVGVAAAALAFAKALGASKVGDPDSASLAPEV
jgi:hypothetical protein